MHLCLVDLHFIIYFLTRILDIKDNAESRSIDMHIQNSNLDIFVDRYSRLVGRSVRGVYHATLSVIYE